jgi:hypothetical protein
MSVESFAGMNVGVAGKSDCGEVEDRGGCRCKQGVRGDCLRRKASLNEMGRMAHASANARHLLEMKPSALIEIVGFVLRVDA